MLWKSSILQIFLWLCLMALGSEIYAQRPVLRDPAPDSLATDTLAQETQPSIIASQDSLQQDTTGNLSCLELLSVAEEMFGRGQYLAMIDTLTKSTCLTGTSLEKQDQAAAHRLLTRAYLNLGGESLEAKQQMLASLKKDPGYLVRVGEGLDPYDFAYLYAKYKTTPIVYLGFSAGVNYSVSDVIDRDGVYGTGFLEKTNKTSKWSFDFKPVGFFASIDFAIPLTLKWRISGGGRFVNNRYQYTHILKTSNGNPIGNTVTTEQDYELKYTESQNRFEIPVFFSYQFRQDKFTTAKWFPYVYIGGSFDYLVEARYAPIQRRVKGMESPIIRSDGFPIHRIPSQAEDNEKGSDQLRNNANVSAFAGFGLRRKLNTSFISFDVRFRKGLTNMVKDKNRYANHELAFNFGHVDHDFRVDDFSIAVGYTLARFNHKERSKKWMEKNFDNWVDLVINEPIREEKRLQDKKAKKENRKNKNKQEPINEENNNN